MRMRRKYPRGWGEAAGIRAGIRHRGAKLLAPTVRPRMEIRKYQNKLLLYRYGVTHCKTYEKFAG